MGRAAQAGPPGCCTSGREVRLRSEDIWWASCRPPRRRLAAAAEDTRSIRRGSAPGAGCLAAAAPDPVAIPHARETPGRPGSRGIPCTRAANNSTPSAEIFKQPRRAVSGERLAAIGPIQQQLLGRTQREPAIWVRSRGRIRADEFVLPGTSWSGRRQPARRRCADEVWLDRFLAEVLADAELSAADREPERGEAEQDGKRVKVASYHMQSLRQEPEHDLPRNLQLPQSPTASEVSNIYERSASPNRVSTDLRFVTGLRLRPGCAKLRDLRPL